MKLEIASAKAVRYACVKFHYAKSVPSVMLAFSVFNDKNEWCGVIAFSAGANNNLAKSIMLPQGACLELVRVALNGKQESTGKALSVALKLVKKYAPLCKVVISYADPEQGHLGVIYQATNWIYLGESKAQREVIDPKSGKIMHKRTANSLFGTIKGLEKSKILWKRKYAYPILKSECQKLMSISKSYPKSVQSIIGDASGSQPEEGGSIPT